ncbi:MAG TPA: carboxylating nicotinate-nucleotide diphosphorylase [Vicinamibacterales bacterium]|nr:carboxylating nicotinate-nucleotide diphosphorylase [Vicinamibacterales bacterium]
MKLPPLDPRDYQDIVRRALDEDLIDATGAARDVTTDATVPAGLRARGRFVVKAECVVAGLEVAFECFRALEPDAEIAVFKSDGAACNAGDVPAEVVASARTLLIGERTALNFLQRLSGVATLASRFVDASAGRIVVLDTRKTTPTLRVLEKYAVRAGGATNHRFGLFDAVLVKDNHIAIAGGVRVAVEKARARNPGLSIEVEADTLAQVEEAVTAGADMILVDNMSTHDIRCAVERVAGRAKIEISGGVTLDRIPELAATGADYVSAGALTHSAPAVDIGFDIEPID